MNLKLLVPLVLILLGVVSTVLLLAQRNYWDSQYRDVVACLDYNAAYQLAEVSGEDIDTILGKLRSLGYISIAVSEMTVLSATDKGYIFEANDDYLIDLAASDKAVNDSLEKLIARRNFVIFGRERAEETKLRLKLAYDDNVVSMPVASGSAPPAAAATVDTAAKTNTDGNTDVADVNVSTTRTWTLFSIPREAEVDFNKVALGFDPDEWRRARNAGFDVVPRIVSCEKYDASDIAAVFDDIDRVSFETRIGSMPPDYRIVIFEGDKVPGYPADVKSTAEQIGKRGVYFGWIEFEIQDGAGALASLVSPKVVLTHSISAEEMLKETAPVAHSRFIRALKERNVRLIYVRPFFTGLVDTGKAGSQAVSPLKFNVDYYTELAKAIKDGGFTLAREPATPPFEDWHPLKLFVVAGLIGFAALFIRIVIRPAAWIEPAFWIISIPASAALFMLSPRMLYQGYALLSATIAPVFGAVIALAIIARARARVPADYPHTIAAYFAAFAVTALGGMAIYALIDSAGAFVKVEVFKGVMVSLAVPVLLIATYIWDIRTFVNAAGERIPGWIARFNALLDRKIEFVDMLIVFLGLAALALILLRSGNEAPIGVAQMELMFRERLEDLLSVRPRTKEIVGLPALFFFLAYFHNRKPPSIVLVLLGSVALTSVVNTFCHLHTPIAISLVRALLGALLGVVMGSIAYGLYAAYLAAVRKLKHQDTAEIETQRH